MFGNNYVHLVIVASRWGGPQWRPRLLLHNKKDRNNEYVYKGEDCSTILQVIIIMTK